jgi:adenylosuccinate lyase
MYHKMSVYISPITSRYKAPNTSSIWSAENKILTMRQLWIDLAKFQKRLGINEITDDGIGEMERALTTIDYQKINEYESRFHHDIMAHIHSLSDLCPTGKNMLHLGATSNFINDNVDAILTKSSFSEIYDLLWKTSVVLKEKAKQYVETPTLAYTHLQPAQLITMGKRFAMWNADIVMDLDTVTETIKKLPFRGIKGTVGSEDTLMKMFDNDEDKCDELNKMLMDKYEFQNSIHICGQTYSRKYDVLVIQTLGSICQSIYKMMNDIRLLSGKREVYEYFQQEQIGSSAMPYKMNPITCEKICSLCRLVINHESNMVQTYINQWLERSLDDSAIKRIVFPDCFMLVEYILLETIKCITNIQINMTQVHKNVEEHLPCILSEKIIITGVKMGYNRQDIHERLRKIFIQNEVPDFTGDNIIRTIFEKETISMNPLHYIGRCISQVNNHV